jgi:hypothetical protein
VNVFTPTYSPPNGYKVFPFTINTYLQLRIALILFSTSFTILVNLLKYELNWLPVKSSVGNYACNPVTYPDGFVYLIPGLLTTFLSGAMFPGNIYSYGMPLQSGLIGGWGAMPIENPVGVYDFEVTHTGPIFIVDTDCSDPIVDDYVGLGTSLLKIDEDSFDFSYKVLVCCVLTWPQVRIKVIFPAFSHNAPGLENSSISQICDVRFLTGEAEVQMRFEQDEWDILSSGNLVNITFPADNLSVYNQKQKPLLTPSNRIYYDQIAIILEKEKHKWAELIERVATVVNDMLDGVSEVSYTLDLTR